MLVATPGRLLHLVHNGHIDLSTVKYLVLDEADKLMQLGFMEKILEIQALGRD